MGRPQVNLEPHRDWLIFEYQNDTSIQTLLNILKRDHSITITRRLFYNRLKAWGISPKQTRTVRSKSLEDRLAYFYFEYGLSDKNIYQDLKDSGFEVSRTGVTTARVGLEIYRHLPIPLVHERQQQLRDFFTTEKVAQGITQRLGRGNLYTHMRQRQYNLSRDAIFKVYREFHDDKIQERLKAAQRRRGGWTTPGPNYIWSVDGHLKLAQYGFEIYAAIDAHSRFIPWFFVGFSGLTARSVFAQYMHIVGAYGFIPQLIRSDRGNETVMMATAHNILTQHTKARRFPRQLPRIEDLANGQVPQPEPERDGIIPWSECWSWGKSTHNQRIESWWNQLQENRTLFWRVRS
ncbi:hypothetical protein F4861DRAFT_544577 [Xylaria intraflava]|nr:hypothetical protein F4861DRAFT_544577 [Xylaria intraflava]